MFHSQNGLYFVRGGGSSAPTSVTIINTDDGKSPREDFGNVLFAQTLDDGTWCSAVCTVSLAGEADGRWYEAMAFHNDPHKAEVSR